MRVSAGDISAHADLAAAWQHYAQGQRDDALILAQRAAQSAPDWAEPQVALGWFHLERQDHDLATWALDRALLLAPDHPVALWHRASLYQAAGAIDQAEAGLRRALSLAPDLTDARFALAWLLHDQGQVTDALHHSRQALAAGQTPARLAQMGWLILCQPDLSDQDQATGLELLYRAHALTPDDPAILRTLALSLGRLHRDADLIRLADSVAPPLADQSGLSAQLGWAWHRQGRRDDARALADRLTTTQADQPESWALRATIAEADGDDLAADQWLAQALALRPQDAGLSLHRVTLLRRLGQEEGARWLLGVVLARHPTLIDALLLQAQMALDAGNADEARRILHRCLKQDHSQIGEIWRLLAIVCQQRHRFRVGRLAAARAIRLSRQPVEALRLAIWLDVEAGALSQAVAKLNHLLALVPGEAAALEQSAHIRMALGDPVGARLQIETALCRDPDRPSAWLALGEIRDRLGDRAGAITTLHHALVLASPGRVLTIAILRVLAAVLSRDDRPEEAALALQRVLDLAPNNAAALQDLTELSCRIGNFAAVPPLLDRLAALPVPVRMLERLRALYATRPGGDAEQARTILTQWLLRQPEDETAASWLLRQRARGDVLAGDKAVALLPRPWLRRRLLAELDWLIAHSSGGDTVCLASFAHTLFPDDAELHLALLYAQAMQGTIPERDLLRDLRAWGRALPLALPAGRLPNPPMERPGRRLRVAYLASHLHLELLRPVLVAHDRERIEILLYTDASLPGDLAAIVTHLPISTIDVPASLALHQVDVAVDTGGLHACHNQYHMLIALARSRVRLRYAWLGHWAPAASPFTVMVADAVALPTDKADPGLPVLRLPGGQWAWTPPDIAPDPGPLPRLHRHYVTFGIAVRGLRWTDDAMAAWAAILAAVPRSRLLVIGHQGQDHSLRLRLHRHLAMVGIAPDRIDWRAALPHADYLAIWRGVDIALDSFPANGGISLLDPLWMGVPVVTLLSADAGLPGHRQGAAVLHAADCAEWVAPTVADYIGLAAGLANDPAGLAQCRAGLRDRLRRSPLCDGRRIAAALEADWHSRLAASQTIAGQNDKERLRSGAADRLRHWLDQGARLTLPCPDQPDLSVILVQYQQGGLTLACLQALADQQDAHFETILIDNGSTGDSLALLDRLDGPVILRNPGNDGFLLAVNRAAAQARGRHILLLNNDALPLTGALAAAVARLDSDAGIGAVGGLIVLADGRLQEAGCHVFGDGSSAGYGRGTSPLAAPYRSRRDVDFCSGAFLAIRAPLWRALGGFDPLFAPAYYEETDLCLRLHQAGFRVVYDPAIRLCHLEFGSAASDDDAVAAMKRNRTLFLARHQPLLANRPLADPDRRRCDARLRWIATPRPRVLVIDNEVPIAARGGGLPRARLMLQVLGDTCHVTLFPLWRRDEDWREIRQDIPDTIDIALDDPPGMAGLEQFLDRHRGLYDTIMISRPPNMARLVELRQRRPALFEGARLIYDAEALFALREIAEAAVKGHPWPADRAQAHLTAELDLCQGVDGVLAVSKRDASWFRRATTAPVALVAHSQPTRSTAPGPTGRAGLLFVGALVPDTPNEDGLLWFIQQVMPRLRRHCPNGDGPVLNIVGTCRSPRLAALAGPDIRLLGRVEDLTACYDAARAFIAPVRFAGGVPIKVIEAAGHGVPVVASALLFRQLGWASGSQGLAARDADAFAAMLARLLVDDALWQRLQRGAFAAIAADYAPQLFADRLNDMIRPWR